MKEKRRPWVMLAPSMLIILLFFIGGVVFSLLQSLGLISVAGAEPALSLAAYQKILTDRVFLASLGYSFYIAFASTALSIVVAIVIAVAIRKTFVGKKIVLFTFQFPLPIPHIVSAVAILMLFTQSGFISRFLYGLGVVSEPKDFPAIVMAANGIGILLSFMWKYVPYIGVAVIAVLQTIGNEYEEQAISLGASPWQRFRHVLLPLVWPAVYSNFILLFAYAFGSYEVPFLLGGTFPETLSVVAFRIYNDIDLNMRPQAMAMANVITVVVLFLIMVYRQIATRIQYKGR